MPKGEYILTATKVSADQWHLNVLDKEDRVEGRRRARSPTAKAAAPAEQFTIDLTGGRRTRAR